MSGNHNFESNKYLIESLPEDLETIRKNMEELNCSESTIRTMLEVHRDWILCGEKDSYYNAIDAIEKQMIIQNRSKDDIEFGKKNYHKWLFFGPNGYLTPSKLKNLVNK